MFDRILPQRIDNSYRGHKLALWIFGVVVSVRTVQSVAVIVNGHDIVSGADGIPLDTFPRAAAQTVLAVWALYGAARLMTLLLCVLALVRYRSAISLMFALLALNYLVAQLIERFIPIGRTGTPVGPAMNFVLFVLMIVGLALSLRRRGDVAATRTVPTGTA
jgi:hypothetical protein